MKALQLIYTSWKNGNSQEKGYMVYSKSNGISNDEVEDIKRVMKYIPPRGLNAAPTDEEIASIFPYNFSFFQLESGRVCVALATYLGKDYSNRFGNYIIYALILEENQLIQYPYEFFGESFMKTSMTEEELNADSPVPPLEELEIGTIGEMITDDILIDFVSQNEEQATYAVSAALQAQKEKVPFYINDTRENIVLWISLFTRLFPVSIARKIYFSTYVFDQEKMRHNDAEGRALSLDIQGVRPDANNFNYHNASTSSKQIVMDSLNGIITQDVEILEIAKDLIEDFTIGMDDIEAFDTFLEKENYANYSYDLSYAYQFYKLNKYKQFDCQSKQIVQFLDFGTKQLTNETNTDAAINLLELLKLNMEKMELGHVAAMILFIYQNAGFMAYSVHSSLFDFLFRMAEESEDEEMPFIFLSKLYELVPVSYNDMLDYFVSGDLQSQMALYLTDNEDVKCNLFFTKFIILNYRSKDSRSEKSKSLLLNCLNNLARNDNSGMELIKVLSTIENDDGYIKTVIKEYSNSDSITASAVSRTINKWFAERLTLDQSSHVLDLLMDDPETVQIAINVGGEYIRNAEDKYSAFWKFYNNHKEYFLGAGAISLDYMLDAYVGGVFAIEDSQEIIKGIEPEFLVKYNQLQKILQPFEEVSVKKLISNNGFVVQQAADMAIESGMADRFPKLISVANGSRCVRKAMKNVFFAELMKRYPLRVENMEKKDYVEYLDNFLYSFILTLNTKEELIDLFLRFCMPDYREAFYVTLNDCLKGIRKKDRHHWESLLVWISVTLINKRGIPDIVADYTVYFYRVLRKLDVEDFESIQAKVFREIPGEKSALFFEKSLEKESIFNRVGGVFKKAF